MIPPQGENSTTGAGDHKQSEQAFDLSKVSQSAERGDYQRPAPPEVPRRVTAHVKPVTAFPKKGREEISSPIFHIEVAKIRPNPEQPRRNFDQGALRELANSIREFGVLQPLLVLKIERDTDDGQEVEYQLIAGERRLRAAELAGLEQVPVVVHRSPLSPKEQLELSIIENLQREDLNPIEAARAFARLQDEFYLTQREIATRLGKSRESIANALRLLSLPSSVQLAIQDNKITESQGRALLMVSNPGEQEKLFHKVLEDRLSVREIRHKIKSIPTASAAEQKIGGDIDLLEEYDDPEISELKEQLEEFFSAPVTIRKQGNSGRIVIEFYSPEELRGIALKLTARNDKAEEFEGDSS